MPAVTLSGWAEATATKPHITRAKPHITLSVSRETRRENPFIVSGTTYALMHTTLAGGNGAIGPFHFFERVRAMRPLTILLGLAAILSVSTAYAQRDAASKIRGEYNFYGGAAGTSMRSAQEYSRGFQSYGKSTDTVNPQIARDASDAIGTYISKAQAHFAYMRKQAQASNDKDTVTALDSIDKHLAAAAKSHAEMKETCLKDHVPGQPVLECCKQIDEHLAKAIAEHDKLMKKLKK